MITTRTLRQQIRELETSLFSTDTPLAKKQLADKLEAARKQLSDRLESEKSQGTLF